MPEETKAGFAQDELYDPFENPDPKFIIKMPDGSPKAYDPFDLFEQLTEEVNKAGDGGQTALGDVEKIRQVFGFPSKASGQPTISPFQAIKLCQRLKVFLEKLTESVKNGQGLTQK